MFGNGKEGLKCSYARGEQLLNYAGGNIGYEIY